MKLLCGSPLSLKLFQFRLQPRSLLCPPHSSEESGADGYELPTWSSRQRGSQLATLLCPSSRSPGETRQL